MEFRASSIRHFGNMHVEPRARQERGESKSGKTLAREFGAAINAGFGFLRFMPRPKILQKSLGISQIGLPGISCLGSALRPRKNG